eukprot:1785935-Amphidinium_carterae.1
MGPGRTPIICTTLGGHMEVENLALGVLNLEFCPRCVDGAIVSGANAILSRNGRSKRFCVGLLKRTSSIGCGHSKIGRDRRLVSVKTQGQHLGEENSFSVLIDVVLVHENVKLNNGGNKLDSLVKCMCKKSQANIPKHLRTCAKPI